LEKIVAKNFELAQAFFIEAGNSEKNNE